MTTRYLSPPEIAETLGVSPDKVLGWIRAGKLHAVNVGNGSQQPRFRVSPEALETFLAAISVVAEPAPAPRRRAKGRWY